MRHALRQLWRTPSTLYALVLAWILLFGFTFFWGRFLSANQASFDTFFSFHPWVYILLAPALTLFGWPEEARRGTLKRYINVPTSPLTLLLMPFIARLTALAVFLIGTLPFAGIVWWLGSPEWMLYITGLLGSFVLGAIMLALSTLMSLNTARPLVAFVRGILMGAAVLYVLPSLQTPLGGIGWSLMSLYQESTMGLFTLKALLVAALLLVFSFAFASFVLGKTLKKKARTSLCVGCLSLVALFAVPFIPPLSFDATLSQRHSLHPNSQTFVESLTAPTSITLYTPKSGRGLPPYWQNHMARTVHTLTQIAALNEALTLHIIHPETSPAGEHAARSANLTSLPQRGAQPLFHGVTIHSTMGHATLPQLNPDRGHLLEFDLMGALLKASRALPPQIGLLTEMNLDPQSNPTTGGKRPQFLEALISTYGVKKISAYEPVIPAEIDLLLVLQTPSMSLESVYALDQYLAGGGKALLLMDPFFRSAPSVDLRAADRNADAKNLDHPADILRALGVTYNYKLLAADNSAAMPIELEDVGRTRYPLWLNIGRGHMASGHPMLTNINGLSLIEPGFFELQNTPESLTLTPLLATSTNGQYVVREDLLTLSPQGIAANLRGEGAERILALDIQGRFPSLWRELPEEVKQYIRDYAEDPSNVTYPTHLTKGQAEGRLIAIADLDFLSDDYTLATQRGGEPSFENPLVNDNLMFLFNVVQTLLDEDVLVPLRNRAPTTRPFHKLDARLSAAAGVFTLREAAIGEELLALAADTQTLTDKLKDRAPTTKEQEELTALAVREVALQRQLRAVHYQLSTLLSRIGTVLTALATLMPILLSLLGWLLYIGRAHKGRNKAPKHL